MEEAAANQCDHILEWKVAQFFPNVAHKWPKLFHLSMMFFYLATPNCEIFGLLFKENLSSRPLKK